MNKAEIANIILKGEYTIYGLRHLTSDESYEIGEELRNSYDWDYENDQSTYNTNEPVELPGACAIHIHAEYMDEVEEVMDEIDRALRASSIYGGDRIALIAGDYYEYGNDEDEVIIRNADFLGLYEA